MGKATILSGGPEGHYSIKLDTGEAARTAKVTALDKQLADLVVNIEAAQTKFNAQKVLEDAKQVAVEAAITAYATAGTLAGTTYAAIVPAQTRLDAATENLRLVNLAPEGTLPDVTKLQATLVDLLAEQVSTATAAQTSMDNARAAIDAVSAKKTIFEATHSAYTAACDDLTTAQSVELVKTQALVAVKQAGGDTSAEQAAYLAATLATGDASTQLTSAKASLAAAMMAMQDAQSLLSNMQGAQALDAGAIDASWRYATAGQELLAIYVADGDVADNIKGSQRANIEALYALYAPQKTVCDVSVGEAGGKAGPLDTASDDQDGRISDALSAASVLQATASALWVKRDAYVAAALLTPAEFTVVQTAYQDAIESNDQAALDLTQANIDFGDAFDAWALAFDDLQMAVLIAVVDLQNMLLASADYADAAHPPLHAFYLTPAAITRTHEAAQEEVTNAQAGLSGAKSAYDAANAAIASTLKAYTKVATELQELRLKTAPLRLTLEGLQATQTQAQKDRTYWAGLVLSETRQAWCADLTEDATGTVATLEIPGESALVLIEPAAPKHAPEHGLLVAREVQSGPQVFWNAAVLPGWQKFKPTYRRGTITAIHAGTDTADVLLTDDRSSAQKLGINQTETLEKVPVQYMTCHAGAFAVGDKCVVKFKEQDWAQPRIVGFVDHPKACNVVLSGVVRRGALTAMAVPSGSPAAYALDAFKPTANCWQYPLRSNPDKSPGTFSLEPALGKAGIQYGSISPANYSGRMAQAVAAVMGQGKPVPFESTFICTHGITQASDGSLWLVEISLVHGAIATKLDIAPASASNSTDAVRACLPLFGGIPLGTAMPIGPELASGILAGKVIRLAQADYFAEYFVNSAYAPWLGWSINDDGTEWHNTCYRQPIGSESKLFGCHFKVLINITKDAESSAYEGTAILSLVAEGPLSINIDNGQRIPFEFGSGVGSSNTLMPSTLVSEVDAPSTTPLFVCHQQGALQVINLEITPREDFDAVNVFNNAAGVSYPWSDWSYTRQSNRGGRRVYSAQVSTRTGTAVEKCVANVVFRFSTTSWTKTHASDGWYLTQDLSTTIGVHFSAHRWVDRGKETIVNPRHARDAYFYIRNVSDENHAFYTEGFLTEVADWLPPPSPGSETPLGFMPTDATLVPGYTDTNANKYKYSFVSYQVQTSFDDGQTRGAGHEQLDRIYPNYQHAGGVDLTVYSRHAPPRTVDLVADTALGTAEQAAQLDVEESVFGTTPQMIYGNDLGLRGTGPDCADIDFGAASSGTPYKFIGYF